MRRRVLLVAGLAALAGTCWFLLRPTIAPEASVTPPSAPQPDRGSSANPTPPPQSRGVAIVPSPFVGEEAQSVSRAVPEPTTRADSAPVASFVTGRLLGVDGAPLKSHAIRAIERSRRSGEGSSRATDVTRDNDGRFR